MLFMEVCKKNVVVYIKKRQNLEFFSMNYYIFEPADAKTKTYSIGT